MKKLINMKDRFNSCYREMIRFNGRYEGLILYLYCIVNIFITIYCLLKGYLHFKGIENIYIILCVLIVLSSVFCIIYGNILRKDLEKNFYKVVIVKNYVSITLYSCLSIMAAITSRIDVIKSISLINFCTLIVGLPIVAYIKTRTYVVACTIGSIYIVLLDLILTEVKISIGNYGIITCSIIVGIILQFMKVTTTNTISKYQDQRNKDMNDLLELNNEITRLNSELKLSSITDSLTSLYNRTYLTTESERIWNECKKNNDKLTVVMIDVDGFKLINDCYGHAIGDICLKKIANMITEHVISNNGIAFRYGGEEFIVIFTKQDENSVKQYLSQLSKNISQIYIKEIDGKPVTISYGISTDTPTDNFTFSNMITIADKRMYDNKNSKKEYR